MYSRWFLFDPYEIYVLIKQDQEHTLLSTNHLKADSFLASGKERDPNSAFPQQVLPLGTKAGLFCCVGWFFHSITVLCLCVHLIGTPTSRLCGAHATRRELVWHWILFCGVDQNQMG